MNRFYAAAGGILLLVSTAAPCLAQEGGQRPLFAPGECTGVLCSTIGGSQAPQNQPRKSLFPEGECGGVLCAAIGGSQAPRHAEAPPPCGGGILCDMAPYAMGQPFLTAEQRAQQERQRREAAATAAPAPSAEPAKVGRHRKTRARRTAATN